MNTYVAVHPGVNLSRHLMESTPSDHKPRITKTWVRAVMRDHPEWDWRVIGGTAAVNGEDAIREDLTLQVMSLGIPSTVAMINYQADDAMPFGYKAVVS